MPARSVTLLLCALGAVPAMVPPHARPQRALSDSDRWQNLIAEYSRGASSAWAGGGSNWLPSAIPLQVPLQGDNSGRASMTVLVVPVPVLVPAPAQRAFPAQCTLSALQAEATRPRTFSPTYSAGHQLSYNVPPYLYNQVPTFTQPPENSVVPSHNSAPQRSNTPSTTPAPLPSNIPYTPPAPQPSNMPSAPLATQPSNMPSTPLATQPSKMPAAHMAPQPSNMPSTPLATQPSNMPAAHMAPQPSKMPFTPPAPQPSNMPSTPPAPQPSNMPSTPPAPPAASVPSALPGSPALLHVQCESQTVRLTRPPTRDSLLRSDRDEQLPRRQASEDSRLLVEQFRAQIPVDPSLPPIGTDRQSYPQCKRRRSKAGGGEIGELEIKTGEAPPPLPRFGRSLFVRARLTVPRAGYTEPYSMWWDAASGATRVDFHGGTTSSYRMVQCDGRMQNAQIRVDRSGEVEVCRYVLSVPRRVPLTERSLPALPDLQAFSFAGYVVRGAERAERWQYTLSSRSGELGGARGEALTFRHELLVKRSADNYTTTPYWYSVRVDSSVLGADCDGYVHYFDKVQVRHHDSSMFQFNIADACEQIEKTSWMEDVEPLREFTMLRRDPRHDTKFEQYKQIFGRIYADDREEAVRKNLLMQMTRFTESGNRQGATMQLATNFISDHLLVEQKFLLGTLPPVNLMEDYAQPFPISDAKLEALRGRQPRNFDWRKIGAVSEVRNQTENCAACWAIATVGAVETQLFKRIGYLVPLSEQALVDCAKPYGAKGCTASKQRYAYNYIIDKGLPAYDEYPFIAKEQQCRAGNVTNVTHISGYYNVTQNNILALKVAIRRFGPTVLTIDGSLDTFRHFNSGRYYDEKCSRDSGNHAVLAVGWTEVNGETDFIIKNSWGDKWGENGYVNLRLSKYNTPCGAYSKDACGDPCGVLRRASLPNVRRKDVRSLAARHRSDARGRTFLKRRPVQLAAPVQHRPAERAARDPAVL